MDNERFFAVIGLIVIALVIAGALIEKAIEAGGC
jgi:hypothetical protein